MLSSGRVLEDLTKIALSAGEIILQIYQQDFAAIAKQDGSPVTAADTAAEVLIIAALRRHFPSLPVVAEESMAAGATVQIRRQFFLVDPLDGTREFVSRNGEFTVNIGLIDAGMPRLGVVYAPALGVIFAGELGSGARTADVQNGQITAWRAARVRSPERQRLTVLASRSHRTPETDHYLRQLPPHDLLSVGSSLKFCRVAAGEADIYPRFGRTMEWDTAAGDAVLRAAGGCVLTLDGAPLAYGKSTAGQPELFANPDFIAASSAALASARGPLR